MQPLTTDMLDQDRRETSWSYPGWRIVVAGFFGVMVSFAAIVPYTFGLFIQPLWQTFGWHREAISVGFSIAALTVAAASPGLGVLLDRFGPGRVVLPCVVVFSSALASLACLLLFPLPRYSTIRTEESSEAINFTPNENVTETLS